MYLMLWDIWDSKIFMVGSFCKQFLSFLIKNIIKYISFFPLQHKTIALSFMGTEMPFLSFNFHKKYFRMLFAYVQWFVALLEFY